MKKPANIEVSVNDRVVSLTCKATGQPAPQITWRKDRQSLPQDGRHVVRADGTLDILEPKADDAGVYECMARNDAGLVISEASLRYEGIEGQYKFCGDVLINQLTDQTNSSSSSNNDDNNNNNNNNNNINNNNNNYNNNRNHNHNHNG